MNMKRALPPLLGLLLITAPPVSAAEITVSADHIATLVEGPEQTGEIVVTDLLAALFGPVSARDAGRLFTGTLGIENPYDTAYVITELRVEVVGEHIPDDAYFTLNGAASHCRIDPDDPEPALSLAAYAEGGGENRALLRRMITGNTYLSPRSVKYYTQAVHFFSESPPPGDVRLDLYLTLHAVGVEGVVFVDGDGDGRRSSGERGIPGAAVWLVDEAGDRVDQTTTDHRGYYLFRTPAPGSYRVEVQLPGGYSFGPAHPGLYHRRLSEPFAVQLTDCVRRDVPAGYAGLSMPATARRVPDAAAPADEP